MANPSHEVELHLPGINKTWIRYKGEWRDKKELEVKVVKVTIHEPVQTKSRGWKFWKKRPVNASEINLEEDL